MNAYFDRGMQRVVTLKSDIEEVLEKFPDSLIATTACIGGELGTCLRQMIVAERMGDKDLVAELHNQIVEFMTSNIKLFGDDFYVEVAPGRSEDQLMFNHRVAAVAKAFNVKMVIGTDAHYLKKEDRFVHKAYLNSKGGEREVDAFYEYAYLQTEEEIIEHLADTNLDYAEMVKNSYEIYEKIENYSLEHKQVIPVVEVKDYPIIEGEGVYQTLTSLLASSDIQERYWINECIASLHNMKLPAKEEEVYLERLETEADVIKYISEQLGDNLFAYFNTMKHYIDTFWEEGSIVGPGRGSAVGFLSNYLLGITQLDPIQWNLPYWRLNSNSLPIIVI